MNYYDGINSFRGYVRRVFKWQAAPYDWADLSPKEREKYAERESKVRERREKPRS